MEIDYSCTEKELVPALRNFWGISARKISALEKRYNFIHGAPVFTKNGHYTSCGWTEWTLGFVFGSYLLQFDATDETRFLTSGKKQAQQHMGSYITHTGVHDHGFNSMSTFGNLLRLAHENRFEATDWEKDSYTLALRCSGAVQANRWTPLPDGNGYIYSFNGPHSLFADTIRTLRVLAIAHRLGHVLRGENDSIVSLLDRLIAHMRTTARYTVYYGNGRDHYDTPGRVAHESIFNCNNGNYRCPNSQQGYSPFSTWTRGLAWIILGFSELLEFMEKLDAKELENHGGKESLHSVMMDAAKVTSEFYIAHTSLDGIPFWDTGAPQLYKLGDYQKVPSDPFNPYEPVDSSAAAIASQGLLRFGHYLLQNGNQTDGTKYYQAGLTVLCTLLEEPYLGTAEEHEGLLLHSIYHRPNGWDHIPETKTTPCGESSMWGDYHLREAALYALRMAEHKEYLTFFNGMV